MHRVALNVVAPRGFGGPRKPEAPPVDACHLAGAAPPVAPVPTQRGRAVAGLQPGTYTVRLSADGQVLTQPVTIKPDPRGLPPGSDPQPEEDDDE